MATASVSNTFINGTAADADEVNQNFISLVDFLNASVVHRDGSKAMTSALDAGSNRIINVSTPTATTDAVTKAYADALPANGAITSAKTDVSAWTALGLLNSWVDYTGRQGAQYRKRFDEVSVRGNIRNGSTTSGAQVFILPPGFRPPDDFYVPITTQMMDTDGSFVPNGVPRLFVQASGSCTIHGLDYSGSPSPLPNADVSFCFTFSTSA